MSKFQGRLWRVDELHSRWNRLKETYADTEDAAVFEEITWNGTNLTIKDFVLPVIRLAGLPIDERLIKVKLPNEKAHTTVSKHGRDYECLLEQDREYKELMGYDEAQIVGLQPLSQSSFFANDQIVI